VRETAERIRILLADGHDVFRQGMRRIFDAELDLDVVGEASNGQEAIKLARDLRPDVIIMEASVPGLDSVEVTRQIKRQQPEVALLVLTEYDELDQIVRLLGAGVGGCLLKSTRGDNLVQAIRFVKTGAFVCHPELQRKFLKRTIIPEPVKLDFGQHLTSRETQVLKLAAQSMSNRDIAAHLELAEGTIKGYFVSIFNKVGVSSRTEAVLEALKRGWINLEDG